MAEKSLGFPYVQESANAAGGKEQKKSPKDSKTSGTDAGSEAKSQKGKKTAVPGQGAAEALAATLLIKGARKAVNAGAEKLREAVTGSKERRKMGGGGKHGGVPPTGGERKEREPGRKFSEIQKELISLVNLPPDLDREERLIFERAERLREPKERGVFDGIHSAVAELQNSANFPASLESVAKINIDDYMRALRAQRQVDLSGLDLGEIRDEITEYRDVAVLVMNQAFLYAVGEGGRAEKLTREIQLRAWNTVPRTPYSLAMEYVSRLGQQGTVDETGRPTEKRQSLREVPLYFGAVFRGGKNEIYVDRHDLIPTLEAGDKNHRDRFIFKNIHAFDYRFGKGSAWKGAIEDWIKDFEIANVGAKIDPDKEKDPFIKKMKAMMAVTASARAMENSAGVGKDYCIQLVGANEKGEPNLSEQGLSGSFLLHADPEKLIEVLRDPLVKGYYDILMKDAGLVNDPYYEWRQFQSPDDSDKKVQVASTVFLNIPGNLTADQRKERIKELRKSRLIEYLKNSADNGGFSSYIEKVLLKTDDPDDLMKVTERGFGEEEKLAAARIACDAFLVDKWTRWEDLITEGNSGLSAKLSLQPESEWEGDPLKSILKPTSLPRLKKVYTGADEIILDFVDKALKPDDIFSKVQAEYSDGERYEKVAEVHPLIPSMVTNLKAYSRLSDATYKLFGGSMSDGLPNWSSKTVEELPQIANLLVQVYGTKTIKDTQEEEDIPIGKHIVGDMMMRILYAKTLATTVESRKPGFRQKIGIIFNPESKTRPFLEVMQYLYGPDLDARRGFIQSLIGGRTRLKLKGNFFEAEKFYKSTYNLLQTDDQGGGAEARTLNAIGLAFDLADAIREGFGIGGKR